MEEGPAPGTVATKSLAWRCSPGAHIRTTKSIQALI